MTESQVKNLILTGSIDQIIADEVDPSAAISSVTAFVANVYKSGRISPDYLIVRYFIKDFDPASYTQAQVVARLISALLPEADLQSSFSAERKLIDSNDSDREDDRYKRLNPRNFPLTKSLINNLRRLDKQYQIIYDACAKEGLAIKINSGYRTPEHNLKVGGVPTSNHLKGLAVDIGPATRVGLDVYTIVNRLIESQSILDGELILYDTFVHYACTEKRKRLDFRKLKK